MKKFAIVGITLLVLFAVAGTTLAAGFGGRGNGTGQSNGTGQPMLDVSTPITLSGMVMDISHYATGESPSRGEADSYILFRSNSGEEIHLVFGPSWYMEQAGLALAVGDTLTVTGYREVDGDLVVASLVKDGQTLALRDDTGRPLWTGSRGQGMGQAGTGSGMGRRGNNGGQALGDGTCANYMTP